MKRILVTGSRTWTDEDAIADALHEFAAQTYEDITLVQGGARGADHIAVSYAEWRGWKVETHLADWKKHGRSAGYIRNQEMVDAGADLCLAFILDGSKGATACAAAAEKAAIPTRRFEVSS